MTAVGFTGTKNGMTKRQKLTLANMLEVIEGTEFHHGDDKGADSEAHDFAKLFGYRMVGHPPENSFRRAFRSFDEEREPKPYLERNHDIVNDCEVLFVCPRGMKEERRSGTWATWRYAKKCIKDGSKIKIIIIWPKEE